MRVLCLMAAVLVGLLAGAAPASAMSPASGTQAAHLAADGETPAEEEPTDEPTDGEEPEGGGVSEEANQTCSTANEGYNVCVVLVDQAATTDEFPNGTPIEGVTVLVTGPEGEEVGEATTDENGFAAVPLEVGGAHSVELDADTLPEGTELSNPDQIKLSDVNMFGFSKTVQFPIGLDERVGASSLDRVIRLLYSGLKFGLLIALASLGLSLIFGTTGLTNFAHGELITLGGLLTLSLNASAGIPVALAIPLAFLIMMALGYGQEVAFWRPLRRRGTGNIALMIVSIGLAILLRYAYQYIYGSENQQYRQYVTQDPFEIGPLRIIPKELFILGISIVVLVVVSLALAKTRIGKATRAVADNPALASSSGINVNTVIALVWILGAALAGLSGALLGLDQGIEFQTGQKILLVVFAAVTLGGLGTIWGAMAGAIMVGLFTELSTLIIPSELKNVGALFLLIVILIFKPQGIFGRAERVG
jgi:branched-chain amino acid transport system permease protein